MSYPSYLHTQLTVSLHFTAVTIGDFYKSHSFPLYGVHPSCMSNPWQPFTFHYHNNTRWST